jgi:phosphoribosylformylglycinamidine synthase
MAVAPRILVLRAPGTNCDEETAYAFDKAGGIAERVHVNRLIENPTLGERYQVLCIPGGFSYGDDIAAGRILASRLSRHLGDLVRLFTASDRLVLGICNGFQVLMRLGILTHDLNGVDDDSTTPATLTWNNHGRFEDRWVHLRTDATVQPNPCVFLKGIERMYLPMAHAEGKFLAASPTIFENLANAGRLALRYTLPAEATVETIQGTANGESELAGDEPVLPFPYNPNGAQANVAGICDASGRMFGLMPHPERHIDPTHHPYWTRRKVQPEFGDGMKVFQNAIEYFS